MSEEDLPPGLQAQRDLALACWRDVEAVPVQHSEHCVRYAETMFDEIREDCSESRSYECLVFSEAYSTNTLIYHRAVIRSTHIYGIAAELRASPRHEIDPAAVYQDGELLRSLFEECLRKEREELAEKGLQPALTIVPRTLAEGQMCIREGAPRFETVPL